VIAEPTPPNGEKPLNAFETLTLAPIERRLIDVKMLTAKERNWLDSYHERVRDVISPLVDGETRKWVEKATKAL
jgi:Xaa-Pro aminopeptidase